ncbi:MAG: hypothetical protein LBF69_06140 [Prevotellaceae bacterium]|jgi:hypothetical protein|nr:hypothetical protein [Prevotellaceae bacterium]
MKKSVYLFSMLFFLLAVATGCSDWGEEPELNTLELESANVSFDAYGGTGTIVVKSTAGVTAACGEPWVSISSVSGNTVAITVDPNSEMLSRSTAVTVMSGRKKIQVPVTQSGVMIDFDRSAITLPVEGCDTLLPIKSPVPVMATSSATWLVANISGTTLTLHAGANPLFSTIRAATLTFTAGSFTIPVAVTQQKNTLSYNAYIGTWAMTHTASTPTTAAKISKTNIKVATAGDGTTLRVTLQAGSNASTTFTFNMAYNPATGEVGLKYQYLFTSSDGDVFFAPSSYPWNFYPQANAPLAGLNGVMTGGTTDLPVITFSDNGEGYSVRGMFLLEMRGSSAYIYNAWGDNATTYYNIIMSKTGG